MAQHKVPQDVEAEDKLLGPLSLKQLIFAILGLGFGYLVYFFFANVHPIASVIFIPFSLFFLILGLYQRKDQPAEVFLASAIRFYFKQRKRIWNQEGYQERVVITVPPKVEHRYTKNFTGEEATSRLGNLSRLMDSRGWAAKLTDDWQNPQLALAASSDRLIQPVAAAGPQFDQPIDIQDQNSPVAQTIDSGISTAVVANKQHALQTLQQARQNAAKPVETDDAEVPHYQKYPSMHQKVVTPASQGEQTKPAPDSVPEPAVNLETESRQEPLKDTPQEFAGDGSVEIKLH